MSSGDEIWVDDQFSGTKVELSVAVFGCTHYKSYHCFKGYSQHTLQQYLHTYLNKEDILLILTRAKVQFS